MIYESAQRVESCDECGAEVVSTVSECVADGSRRWDVEGSCRACGHVWHAGGNGISPEVRATILDDRGPSGLRVVDDAPSIGAIMRVIRSRDSLPLDELRMAAHDLVAHGRAGTLTDVTLLREALGELGIRAEIVFPTPRGSGRKVSLVKRVVRLPAPRRLTEPSVQVRITAGELADEEAELLADYLESATTLVIAAGRVRDRLTGRLMFRLGIMTDGEWTWSLAWSDYVRAYRVAPPEDFRDHARSRNYVPVELGPERVHELAAAVDMPSQG